MTKGAALHNVGKTVSSNGAGRSGQLYKKKMKLNHSLTPYTKISSKWIQDLSVRPDTMKLLEENIISDINHSNVFFNLSPRTMEIKTKINKQDLLKRKSFWTAKERKNKKTTHR